MPFTRPSRALAKARRGRMAANPLEETLLTAPPWPWASHRPPSAVATTTIHVTFGLQRHRRDASTRGSIPIETAAPSERHLPRLRALALLRRRPGACGNGVAGRRPRNLHTCRHSLAWPCCAALRPTYPLSDIGRLKVAHGARAADDVCTWGKFCRSRGNRFRSPCRAPALSKRSMLCTGPKRVADSRRRLTIAGKSDFHRIAQVLNI